MQFEAELKKLGLKDKEAAVYLASLELGPSPAQNIARKAKVVRATTYVILEILMKQGLITKFEHGKKTMFSAEPPHQLLRLLEKQQEEIKKKHANFANILPELQMLMKTSGEKPTVRYFEGKEGLTTIRREIIMYAQPGDTIYNFTPIDYLYAMFPNEDEFYRQRMARAISSKTLFTTKSLKVKKELLLEANNKMIERIFIPDKYYPLTSGMTIYRDRIAMGSFTGNFLGAVTESQSMADMMKSLFLLAWDSLVFSKKS